ncbi:hypothetical protein [Raoultibacter phocaeensis]|uniref:hypothetical protein n=1 Tax=Raoultibacter phocaeensis TaxID=2479841 RepID=UPI001119013F|nr:hypothetical protein [Raoultibacter phocaeensis]
MKKLPPFEKVYEAYSALADGRVTLCPDERLATVVSSNGEKSYTVVWDEAHTAYSSSDNATYWQGYAGYPVIAVLMEQGLVPFDHAVAAGFAGIDWAELNERFRRDYAQAARAVIAERHLDAAGIERAARAAYDALAALDIAIKRGSARPPKTKKD